VGFRCTIPGGSTSATTAPCKALTSPKPPPSRRGPGQDLAAQLRRPASAAREGRSPLPGHEARYKQLTQSELPLTECLKDTVARFLPYWHETIAPAVLSGKKVIVAAHGNSLRALVKYLDKISDEQIVSLNIPTGMPLVYELDENLQPLKSYYLATPKR